MLNSGHTVRECHALHAIAVCPPVRVPPSSARGPRSSAGRNKVSLGGPRSLAFACTLRVGLAYVYAPPRYQPSATTLTARLPARGSGRCRPDPATRGMHPRRVLPRQSVGLVWNADVASVGKLNHAIRQLSADRCRIPATIANPRISENVEIARRRIRKPRGPQNERSFFSFADRPTVKTEFRDQKQAGKTDNLVRTLSTNSTR
jgi:hypothetical protein